MIYQKGTFGGTYPRNTYSSVNDKWYKNSWEKLDELKDINQKYYCSNYSDISVNKYGVKCAISLRMNVEYHKRRMNHIDPYGWFQWYFKYWLGRRSVDDKRQIARWKGIVTRFKGKLVKMVRDANSRFDDYSISPKIRQILLHWGYEIVQSVIYFFKFIVNMKMSYYCCNS